MTAESGVIASMTHERLGELLHFFMDQCDEMRRRAERAEALVRQHTVNEPTLTDVWDAFAEGARHGQRHPSASSYLIQRTCDVYIKGIWSHDNGRLIRLHNERTGIGTDRPNGTTDVIAGVFASSALHPHPEGAAE
jgi:hypothetical protein